MTSRSDPHSCRRSRKQKETIEYECYINKVSKLKNWFLKGL